MFTTNKFISRTGIILLATEADQYGYTEFQRIDMINRIGRIMNLRKNINDEFLIETRLV